MVCLGNICRSPMAEGLMRSKIEKYNLKAEVDSAGFERFHSGDRPDFRAVRTMQKHGIDISMIVSRLFKKSDFDTFDLIYVMDQNNFADVRRISSNQEQMSKVDFILNEVYPGSNKVVVDPYYGGSDGFETVYQILDEATECIAQKLRKIT